MFDRKIPNQKHHTDPSMDAQKKNSGRESFQSPDDHQPVQNSSKENTTISLADRRELSFQADQITADGIRKKFGLPIPEDKTHTESVPTTAPDTESVDHLSSISPEQARTLTWYSSNTSVGEKRTPEGKSIYGLSLSTNPYYAQTYSRTKEVHVFNLKNANLKPVTFNYGMTIDEQKRDEILSAGYDGVIFDGYHPEVALLKDVATLEDTIKPVPEGIQAHIDARKSIPVSVAEDYGIDMPNGYVKVNAHYIFKENDN